MQDFYYLKVCSMVKQFMFLVGRYPSFTRECIEQSLQHSSGEMLKDLSHETSAYWSSCAEKHRKFVIILVSIYLAYCLKNSYFPYEAFRLFDYQNLDANILIAEQILQNNYSNNVVVNSIYSISCLTTNCSRFAKLDDSSTTLTLAEDSSKLPFFTLCHEKLDSFYTPVTKLDSVSILAYSASAFNVLLLGAWLPLQQMIFPANDFMLMFIVAPKITRRLMSARARELLLDFAVSLYNFRLDYLSKHSSSIEPLLTTTTTTTTTEGQKVENKSQTIVDYNNFKLSIKNCHSIAQKVLQKTKNKIQVQINENQTISELNLFDSINSKRIQQQQQRQSIIPQHLIDISTLKWKQQQQLKNQEVKFKLINFINENNDNNNNIKERVDPLFDRDKSINSIVKQSSLRNKTLEQFECLVEGCMPIVRTYWWRIKIAQLFCNGLCFSCSLILLIGCSSLVFLQILIEIKEKLFENYAVNMQQLNCSIWLKQTINEQEEEVSFKFINLNEINLKWTLFAWLETVILNFLPGFSIAVMLAIFLGVVCEMTLWLAELRLYLMASLVVAQFKLNSAHTFQSSPLSITSSEQRGTTELNFNKNLNKFDLFKTNQMQQILMLETKFSLGIWLFSAIEQKTLEGKRKVLYNFINSKTNDRVHLHWFVDEMIIMRKNQDKEESETFLNNIETLEQIYVNFRLFVEHVHSYTPSIAVLLVITYLLNYGIVLIAVFCSKNIADFITEPIFMMVCGFIISNFLIFLGANFHANTKKLQPILWSLIAQLSKSDDLRVKHLRSLWLKQVKILDSEGGLALTALKIRITYVNIIQLMIWTATISALALKQR